MIKNKLEFKILAAYNITNDITFALYAENKIGNN